MEAGQEKKQLSANDTGYNQNKKKRRNSISTDQQIDKL